MNNINFYSETKYYHSENLLVRIIKKMPLKLSCFV